MQRGAITTGPAVAAITTVAEENAASPTSATGSAVAAVQAITAIGAVTSVAEQECGIATHTGGPVDRPRIFGRKGGDQRIGTCCFGRPGVAAVTEEPPGVAAAAAVTPTLATVPE
ncbi:hypothetical protein MALGJ_44250 [Mycolicibacter algericus]|uniref:Uncharacterized protein n=1 Tax=Mycolicibacter algericus TaxID=1288388 RepID=A0A7I9YGL4_MYCAL|nr:hypothetical protein MALGJ_44250 [Mycolicibacter algericus]